MYVLESSAAVPYRSLYITASFFFFFFFLLAKEKKKKDKVVSGEKNVLVYILRISG